MKIRPLALALILLPLLSGCAAPLYFLQGKGKQPAAFTIPKNKRVLVFVDLRQGIVNVPPDFSSALGNRVANHLFKYNAATNLVSQDRLTALNHNPDDFAKMGVADVARATEADLVIYIDVVTLNIASTTDNSLSGAALQCFVKVVDSNGVRMWPSSETAGTLVAASIDPNYTESRTQAALMDQLEDLLAIRIGRLFHPYSRDDSLMNK